MAGLPPPGFCSERINVNRKFLKWVLRVSNSYMSPAWGKVEENRGPKILRLGEKRDCYGWKLIRQHNPQYPLPVLKGRDLRPAILRRDFLEPLEGCREG